MANANSGEMVFVLREKIDSKGKLYLFGSLPWFNSVMFIWPEPEVAGQERRWRVHVRPYTGRGNGNEDV